MITNVRVLALLGSVLFIWMASYYVTTPTFTFSTSKTNKMMSSSTGSNLNDLYNDFVPIPQVVSPETTVTFYAHGDVPYTRIQARKLKKQMVQMSVTTTVSESMVVAVEDDEKDDVSDVEFMIHLGDIRMAGPKRPCLRSDYENVASLLRLSPVPVFIILGDNDVHDCPDPVEGLQLWRSSFANFESRYWNHTFPIHRPSHNPDNFVFQHKNVLFIGVNIVGERTNDENIEMVTQELTEQVNWVMDVIRQYQVECIVEKKMVGRVVLFYHANPGPHTRPFFKPLRHFIGNDLNNTVPILFMNGDAHRWMYQPRFYNATSLLRVTVTGLAVEPLLKVTIPMDGTYHDPTQAFRIDRRMPSNTTTIPPTSHGPPY
jgi:hypothetical protein